MSDLVESLLADIKELKRERDEAREIAQCFTQVDRYTAMEARTTAAEAKVAALREAGAQLANAAYNICQRGEADLDALRSLKACHLAWDRALSDDRGGE